MSTTEDALDIDSDFNTIDESVKAGLLPSDVEEPPTSDESSSKGRLVANMKIWCFFFRKTKSFALCIHNNCLKLYSFPTGVFVC